MRYVLGVDFGTTNTAVCARFDDGTSTMVTFDAFEVATHCRSALFFNEADAPGPPHHSAGDHALRDCIDSAGEGRFIQSLKSFLASRVFGATQVYTRKYTLEQLLALFLRYIRSRTQETFGGAPTRTHVGVPVQFAYAKNGDDDDLARSRLRAAFEEAGFGEVRFEYEPVSAAHAYLQRVHEPATVLVADFGGGTSDFALVELEPKAAAPARVLATSGVAVAGDALDAKVVRHLVAPSLGRGSTYVGFDGVRKEISPSLFQKLETWHHLSFMNNAKTLRALRELVREADEPERVAAFIALIEENMGFHLHDAVRRAKQELSSSEETTFSFKPWPDLSIEAPLTRAEFETWIAPELEAIAGALDDVMQAPATPPTVDAVFMTGGTSLVPAVRSLIASRFGEGSMQAGGEFASISTGLAEMAALADGRD
jgi:hypothetical chaperone protein